MVASVLLAALILARAGHGDGDRDRTVTVAHGDNQGLANERRHVTGWNEQLREQRQREQHGREAAMLESEAAKGLHEPGSR